MKFAPWPILVLALTGCGRNVTEGQPAVPFKVETTDGQHFSLLDQTLQTPVVVAFIPDPCESNREVVTYLNLIQKNYAKKLKVIALHEGASAEAAVGWKNTAKPDFPVGADADHLIAEKYGFDRGPVVILVDRGTRMLATLREFTQQDWRSLNEKIAETVDTETARIDFSRAPNSPIPSCPIVMPQR